MSDEHDNDPDPWADPDASQVGEMPGRSAPEVGVAVASAAVQLVPLVGGPAAQLIELAIGPSLGKRRDEWFRTLGEVVDELDQRLEGFDPRDLEGNEQFVSAVLAASTVAIKTHQEEKRRMLRNALVNGVLPGAPDEHEQMTFLRFVDELTPLHVRLVAFLSHPADWFDEHGFERETYHSGTLFTIVQIGLPELKDRRDIYDQLCRDLEQRGLAPGGLHGMMTNSGLWSRRETPVGSKFLAFIALEGEVPPWEGHG